MAATTSERVFIMKQNFMMWHEKGYTIPEIAEMHNLSFSCVYRHLQEIADENNTTREELLKLVRTAKGDREWERESKKVIIDVDKMNVEFEDGADVKAVMQDVLKNCKKVEDDCEIYI